MLFKGKVLIEVEIEATNAHIAQQMLKREMGSNYNGIKKTVLIEPNLEPKEQIIVAEI